MDSSPPINFNHFLLHFLFVFINRLLITIMIDYWMFLILNSIVVDAIQFSDINPPIGKTIN